MEKSKKMMIVIITLLVALLAVIVAGVFFLMNIINKQGTEEAVVEPIVDVAIMDIETISLESPLNINLLDGADGTKHAITINVSIGVDVSSEEEEDVALIEKIRGSSPIIADAVISVISRKTIDDIKSDGAQDLLKSEIIELLQDEFSTNLICRVYFGGIYYV